MMQLNLKPETKAWIIWFSMLLVLLIAFSCGTKTKNKSEFVEKSNQEVLNKDSIVKIEKVISEKVEENLTEYREENKVDSSEKIRITETTETLDYSGGEPLIYETPQGIVRISGSGRITRHTKTAYEELERNTIEQRNIELATKLQAKMDSINEASIIAYTISKAASDIVKKETAKEKTVKTTVFGFWFWFVLILILLIALALWLFRKYLGVQFPFLQMFKFFR